MKVLRPKSTIAVRGRPIRRKSPFTPGTPVAPDETRGSPPSPAGSVATEDGGQRYMDDTSASELSDKYPAGLNETTTNTNRAGGVVEHAAAPKATLDTKISVRVTEAERAAVRRRAQALDVKPSAWIRATLLDELDTRRDNVTELESEASWRPTPQLAQVVDQLRRVGVNLNQEVRRHHSGEGSGPDTTLLHDVLGAVNELRALFGDRTRI